MNLSSTTVSLHEVLTPSTWEDPDLHPNYRENELRLMSDLRMAREVQRQLLHREAPEAPGIDLAATSIPARELGGDFHDLLPYGNGAVALALGDVSGKGTAAALLGALTMGILRTHTVNHAGSPAEVLAALNNYILGNRLDSRFVVMLFAAFDPGTRRLTFANAGCPYPLLLRNGSVEEIKISGTPLGLFEDTRYGSVSLDLQPGDVLVFASDGILECENYEQDAFGSGRLGALLASLPQETPAEAICSAILDATNEFARHASAPDDDRSLLVLRVPDDPCAEFSIFPTIAHRTPTNIC